MRIWRAEDYDDQGNLRARKGMWCVLLLLSHPWWLLAFDMSLEHGLGRVLSAIYPTQEGLYAALACSVSVFVFLFVYPFRQSVPRIMAAAYTLVLTDCVVMMVRMGIQVYLTAGEFDELLWLSLFFLTLGCLVELWPDERNRDTYYSVMAMEDGETEKRDAGSSV